MTLLEPTTIRTSAELEAMWRSRMEPLGFAGRTLWMALINDDGEVFPELVQIDDMPATPSPADATSLAVFMAHLARDTEGVRPAFLFSRPGRGGPDQNDRAWAGAAHHAVVTAGMRPDVVHVATDDTLVPVPLDDLDPLPE